MGRGGEEESDFVSRTVRVPSMPSQLQEWREEGSDGGGGGGGGLD